MGEAVCALLLVIAFALGLGQGTALACHQWTNDMNNLCLALSGRG